MSINLVVYGGHLGLPPRDLQTRHGERGMILNVACNESFLDRAGQRQETTTWVGAACYGKVADYVRDVIQPVVGDELLVHGKLNSYTTNDRGARRTVVQILAKEVRLLRRGNSHPEKHYSAPSREDSEIPF